MLYLLTTLLYFLYSTLYTLQNIQYSFCFDPPMQNMYLIVPTSIKKIMYVCQLASFLFSIDKKAANR